MTTTVDLVPYLASQPLRFTLRDPGATALQLDFCHARQAEAVVAEAAAAAEKEVEAMGRRWRQGMGGA